MKLLTIILVAFMGLPLFAKDLVCTNDTDSNMVLKMSSPLWDLNSNTGKVKIEFFYNNQQIPGMSDSNGRLSDSPFVVGCQLTLPDSDDKMPSMIILDENFEEATVNLYDSEDDTILDYGRYICN